MTENFKNIFFIFLKFISLLLYSILHSKGVEKMIEKAYYLDLQTQSNEIPKFEDCKIAKKQKLKDYMIHIKP